MENFNNISQHLEIIEDIFVQKPEDFEWLLAKLDLSEEEFEAIKSGELEPDKMQLENIYNFAYNSGLFLNEIQWQDRLDEFRKENEVVATHGSRTNIKGNIRVDVSGESNDFGNGFYIGEDISQAGMWVGEEPNSSLYILTFDENDLVKAQFNVSVDWMLAVCYYRNQIPEYANSERILRIREKVDNCDYVYAPIADNKLFEVIDAFVAEEITDLQCLYALSATHLGYQYVLKTERALENLDIIDHLYFCSVEKSLYNKESDVENNTSLYKAFIAKKRYKDQGQYISELLGDTSLKESIQGLENIPEDEIKDDIKMYLDDFIDDNYLDIEIHDIFLNGSRLRGTARENSDLDVIVSYSGNIREDYLFDILHEEPLVMYGIEVDINPVNIDKTDINSYIKKSMEYDKKLLGGN